MRTSSPENLVSAASGLVSEEKLKGMTGQPAAPQNPPAAPENAVQPSATDPNNPPAPPEGQRTMDPIVVKSPLGDLVYGAVPQEQVTLSSFADIAAYAKDVAGVELKDTQDFVSFFQSYKGIVEKATASEQVQKALENYKSTLNSVPPEVSLIVQAALSGEDYMSIINKLSQKSVMDFEQAFEKHDALKLINHYTGKTFTKEAFDALDPDLQENYEYIAKAKYKQDQDEYANIKTSNSQAREIRQKALLASVESSIARMVENNPKMDKTAIDRVRQIMTEGLKSSIFGADNTYLPDAAEKIAYLEFGKTIVTQQAKTIGDIVAKIRGEAGTEATEKLLLRNDAPIPKGGSGNIDQNLLNNEVKKATAFLRAQ